MVCMFVSPCKLLYWNLMPNVMVLGFGVFEKCWGHGGKVLVNEISALIKETPERPFSPSIMWGQSKKPVVWNPKEGLH